MTSPTISYLMSIYAFQGNKSGANLLVILPNLLYILTCIIASVSSREENHKTQNKHYCPLSHLPVGATFDQPQCRNARDRPSGNCDQPRRFWLANFSSSGRDGWESKIRVCQTFSLMLNSCNVLYVENDICKYFCEDLNEHKKKRKRKEENALVGVHGSVAGRLATIIRLKMGMI
jgi:hypothetical protein